MSLADFRPETAVVTFKGGNIQVRGLAIEDVAVLMRNHLTDLEALIQIFSAPVSKDTALAAITTHAVALIREAPGFAANLIALASDEPDLVDKARRLSMPVQVALIKAIAQVTFEEAGGSKKFVESLYPLLAMFSPTQQKIDSPT